MNTLKEIGSALLTLIGVILTGLAVVLIFIIMTSRTGEGVIINGLIALILLSLVTLGAVATGFNRIAAIQSSLLEEAEEQSALLRLIAKQGKRQGE